MRESSVALSIRIDLVSTVEMQTGTKHQVRIEAKDQ